MMNTVTIDSNEKAFALALSVIEDRVRQLPKADRDDLFALLPALCGDVDEEEKASAIKAVHEILNQSPAKIKRMEIATASNGSISNWLAFISARIKAARDDAKMTQEELSVASGLQQSHISRLEKGEHSPTSKTLEKIAKALSLPVDYFNLVD